jgi:hypothetical protein
MADSTHGLTALHEAGHAIVAKYLGLPAPAVTLVPESELKLGSLAGWVKPRTSMIGGYSRTLERCLTKDEIVAKVQNHLRKHILMLFAGAAAERECLPEFANDLNATKDEIDAKRLATEPVTTLFSDLQIVGPSLVSTEDYPAYREAAKAETAAIVKTPRVLSSIQTLTCILIKRAEAGNFSTPPSTVNLVWKWFGETATRSSSAAKSLRNNPGAAAIL